MNLPNGISEQQMRALCGRYQIQKLAIFGSILDDTQWHEAADVDILVEFAADAPLSLFKLGTIQGELTDIFKRPIDLRTRATLNSELHKRIHEFVTIYEYE